MFTGIVEGQAVVSAVVPVGAAYRLVLDLGPLADGVAVGDSVAINGTCLTAVTVRAGVAEFDVIRETVERTAFATVRVGERVNVERSMRADGRFHGHFVTGHVDAAGRILLKRPEPGQVVLGVEVPSWLTVYLVEKGSVAIDGVSLTLTCVDETSLQVCLIPHTLEVTTLGQKPVGSLVNVEVDPIGKWVHRFLTAYVPPPPTAPEGAGAKILQPKAALHLTLEYLRQSGFASS